MIKLKIVIAFLIIICLGGGYFSFADYHARVQGEHCDKNEYTNSRECAKYDLPSFVLIKIISTLDHHEGSVVGLGTLAVAAFTLLLWMSTSRLWREATRASAIAKTAANAARDSADAAVRSYFPVLIPFVAQMDKLHPVNDPRSAIEFESYIQLAFENLGKTVAIIRHAYASLFLMDGDEFPQPDFDNLSEHIYDEVVAADTKRQNTVDWRAVIEVRQKFLLTQQEYSELLAEASAAKFKRFVLLTRVVYDDLFGYRHTACACIKMRLVPHNGAIGVFQTPRGGVRYNYMVSRKIGNAPPSNLPKVS